MTQYKPFSCSDFLAVPEGVTVTDFCCIIFHYHLYRNCRKIQAYFKAKSQKKAAAAAEEESQRLSFSGLFASSASPAAMAAPSAEEEEAAGRCHQAKKIVPVTDAI